MKKAQRSQRKWLKLSLKIDFFGMKNYKKSWVDPPVSHYIKKTIIKRNNLF